VFAGVILGEHEFTEKTLGFEKREKIYGDA